MSEETATPENSPEVAAESAPRARRVSTPRPKKAPKAVEAASEPAAEPAPAVIEKLVPAETPEASEAKSSENDWPEPEAASTGSTAQGEGTKRKRRRRKGKGGKSDAPQNSGAPSHENSALNAGEPGEPGETQLPQPPRPGPGPQQVKSQQPPHQQHPQQHQRPKIDPELLTKMAWKIYLAEVSEEGVALIGDNDAKDLSRRCFRLAEIFIEEQTRRR